MMILGVLLSFLPGYGLLAHVRRLRPAERMACSGPLSAALCGAVALACFLLGQVSHTAVTTWPALLLPILFGAGALMLAARRGYKPVLDDAARQVALFWLLLLGEMLVLELLLPTFGGAGWFADWWVHFHRALVYANLVSVQDVARTCVDPHLHCVARVYDNGVLTARTPLYNLLGGALLGIDGGRMAAYQIAAAIWGALLAGPVVLLAQRRGLRTGAIAGSLLLLNPFLVHLAIYPWPKALTAAFEVLAIYWVWRMRDGAAWAGAAMAAALALATFTHTSALIYVFAIGLYLLWWRRPRRAELRSIAIGTLAAAAVALPWIAWGVHTYGWRGVFLSSPATRSGQPAAPVWLAHKVGGLVSSFLPMPLASDLAGRPLENIWVTVNDALKLPFDTYTGAQGVVACLLLLRWYNRAQLSRDLWRLGLFVAGCAAIGSVVLDSAFLTDGAAVNAMAGATALGIVFLATLEPVQRHRRAVLIAVGAEAAIVFGLYLAYLGFGPLQINPNVPILARMGQRMLSADLGTVGVLITMLIVVLAILATISMLYGAPAKRIRSAASELLPTAPS